MKLLPVILAHAVTLTAFAQQDDITNQMQNAGFTVTARGQHQRVWSKLSSVTNSGIITTVTNNITELNTGLHRWASNQWVVATPEIVLTSTGIVARGAAHSVLFATNANTYAAVQARLSDGQILKSHVLGLAYQDQSTGSNLMFAVLKDCTAQIVGNKRVAYLSCFDGAEASLVYSYTKIGLSQDVIFYGKPPPPSAFGLNDETAHLLLLTEFTESPTPQLQEQSWAAGNEFLTDQTIDFSSMQIVPGRAYLMSDAGKRLSLPVSKTWAFLSGRRVLIERIQFRRVREQLMNLPDEGSPTNSPSATITNASISTTARYLAQNAPTASTLEARMEERTRNRISNIKERSVSQSLVEAAKFTKGNIDQILPPPPPKASRSTLGPVLQVASLPDRNGFVLDYTTVSGSTFYFYCNGNYLINGSVYLTGAYFQSGSVTKYLTGAALYVSGWFSYDNGSCAGQNAVLTSVNDDTRGGTYDISNHSPQSKDYSPALSLPCSYVAMAETNTLIYYADDKVVPNAFPCKSTITIAATDPTATKGASPADTGTFTITRVDGDWANSQSVVLSVAPESTAVSGTSGTGYDYDTLPQSVTIPSYQGSVTVTVQPRNPYPARVAPFEASVILTVAANAAYNVGAANRATNYIADPAVPVTTAPVPAPSGLVGWWRGEANWNDDSLGLHTAVPQNGLGFCSSIVGQAFNFDGIDDRLNVDNTGSLNFLANQDFSIEAWIRPIVATTDYGVQSIIDKRLAPDDYTGTGYCLSLINGQICCQLGVAGTFQNFSAEGPDLRDGKFHHVALSIVRRFADAAHGNILKYYVDGQPLTPTLDPSGKLGDLSNTEPFRIGNHATAARNCYGKGPIDEVSLYNVALTDSQILAIYNAGRAGKSLLPVVSVTAPGADAVAKESGLVAGRFTVARAANDISAALVVNYSLSGGTAINGTDYQTLSGSVMIPAGQASQFVVVTPLNDSLDEPDETVVLSLSASSTYTLGLPSSATVTILDKPTITITATGADATAKELGLVPGRFTVTRQATDISAALTVNYTKSGTATAGSDYVALPTSVIIPANQVSQTITVTPLDDSLDEPDETVKLTISANNAYNVGSPNNATVTIIDKLTATVTATVATATKSATSPQNGSLTFTRAGTGQTQPLVVAFTIATGGVNARNGTDYQTIPLTATIPANSSSTVVNIIPTTQPSLAFESPIVVTIPSSSDYNVGSASSATVYIADPAFPITTAPVAAPSGLVGWWRGEGNALDSAGSNNGAVTTGFGYLAAFIGQGFNFVSTDRVTMDSSDTLNFAANQDFSIEAWIRPIVATSDYGVQSIIDKRLAPDDSTGTGYAFSLVNGHVCCQLGVGGSYQNFSAAGPNLRDGKFHHVALSVVRSFADAAHGNILKYYVDGQPLTPTYDPSGKLGDLSNTEPFRIGNHATSYRNCYFKGPIDEVSLYNTALTDSQILGIYNAGRAGKCLAPRITAQPQNQTVTAGANASFSLGVAATACPPLVYQWFHNGSQISDATASSLQLTAAHLADAGTYTVSAANNQGSTLSAAATLTVQEVATPSFSPIGGSYAAAQNVTVTCPTAGATIRYTTSGVDPTTTDPIVASGGTVPISQSLTLKAKAFNAGWGDSSVESESYRIEATPSDVPPTVTISPPTGTSLLASDSLEILVEASDQDGTVAKIQLFNGSTKIAETTQSPLRYSLSQLSSGSYTFTAKAYDNVGFLTVSAPVTYTVNASGPVVSLVGSQPFFTSSPATLFATVTGVNPGSLSSVTLNGSPITAATGTQTLTPSLVQGANTFTLIAVDSQNRTAQASATVYLDSIAPTISITSPANNSSFTTTRINVSGTFTEASLKSIDINGVPAFISGSTFSALNVPLVVGANSITATATDLAGNTGTATISVTGQNGGGGTQIDPVQLTATPIGGFSPLTVTLTPVNGGVPGTVQNVLYDFDGDGVIDDSSHTDFTSVSHTYSSAGQYFPVVSVITTVGRFSSIGGWNSPESFRLRINVQDPPTTLSTFSVTDPIDLKWTPDGYLYVLSRSGQQIAQYDQNWSLIRSLSGIGTTPTGLDVDSSGSVFVAISGYNQVRKFVPTTSSFQLDTTFNGTGFIGKVDRSSGTANGEFNAPYDVAISRDGSEIDVSDSGNNRIQRFGTDGNFIGTFGQQGSGLGQFNSPKGLSFDPGGYLYITDSGNNRVVLARSSTVLGSSGSAGSSLGQFQGPANLSIGTRGIYVADALNNRVQFFDPLHTATGSSLTPFSAEGSLAAALSLSQPDAVAAVEDLLEQKIYIADTGNDRILLVKLPADDPLTVWNNMVSRLAAADTPGAVANFCSATAEGYRQAFLTLGTGDSASDVNAIGSLTPVFIRGDTAEYYFEQTVDGHLLLFKVEFVKENGLWKILEF